MMVVLPQCRGPPLLFLIQGKEELMSYNHKNESKKWKEWKQEEERLLKELNVEEQVILDLREYDKKDFNKERRFRERENVTDIAFFRMQPHYDKKSIDNVDDMLSSIENEVLYKILEKQDMTTLRILFLMTQDYSIKEIASLLKINESTIFRRMKKLKNLFK